MQLAYLQSFFTAPIKQKLSSQVIFWFSLSLTFAAIYGILALQQAFSSQYVVSSDGMVYLFWLQRLIDPELLSPRDVLVDYWQSVTPWGYIVIFRFCTTLGIDPLVLNKFLPIGLGILTTAYSFSLCMQMLPVPAAAFFATLMLNQALWMGLSLATGTPLSFIYPLFLAFFYYLLKRSLLPCLIALGLQGLFYPQYVFVSVGVLFFRLIRWQAGKLMLSHNKNDYWICAAGVGVAALVLFPYIWKSFEMGMAMTGAQARTLAEFSAEGRHPFFSKGSPNLNYWFCSLHGGILPHDWCILRTKPCKPPQIFLGLSLPILLLFRSRFPLSRQVTDGVMLLFQIGVASLSLFVAAHALFPKLYFPGRYTQHSLRMVMAIAAGIALTILLDAIIAWAKQSGRITLTSFCLFFLSCAVLVNFYLPLQYRKRGLAILIVLAIALGLIMVLEFIFVRFGQDSLAFPKRPIFAWLSAALLGSSIIFYTQLLKLNNFPFPTTDYITGKVPELYKFFAQQPKDILIASLADEANNLPVFAKRSILVGWRFQSPFKRDFHNKFRQRALDLIQAQYDLALDRVKGFIQKYGIDFWLVERNAFSADYITGNSMNQRWIRQFKPATSEATARLKQGIVPALAKVMNRCSAFETKNFVVVNTKCVSAISSE
jgi:hypothetical protein